MSWVAVYAPMKPPDDPVPSGDREIARSLMRALALAGLEPRLVSRLRSRDGVGDPATQARIRAAAEAEAARLARAFAPDPPAAWLTYHCYWKAPDLLGPAVADALDLPYAIAEPSISPRRREGPWAGFAASAEAAIARADRLFWTTERDRPALAAAGHGARMVHLPASLDPGPRVAPRSAARPLRLLTVAMMRPGDKTESYRRLVAALACLEADWRLDVVGDGEAAAEVAALLTPHGPRVTRHGTVTDPVRLRALMEAADLLVWPGVGEGVGLVWLEAQAAGLPVVAEDGPAARAAVEGGVLAPPGAPAALAQAIGAAAADRAALSARGRARIEARHTLAAAAATLRSALMPLLAAVGAPR